MFETAHKCGLFIVLLLLSCPCEAFGMNGNIGIELEFIILRN